MSNNYRTNNTSKRIMAAVLAFALIGGASFANTGISKNFNISLSAAAESADTDNFIYDAETKTLTLKGNITSFDMPDIPKEEVLHIKAEQGTVFPEDSSKAFWEMKNVTDIDLSNVDTSDVTDMSSMFENCNALEKLDISGFDTSNVENMSDLFFNCVKLKNIDVSGFDTSKVNNMGFMFYGCSNLETIDLSDFDTSDVTDTDSMFAHCKSLETLDLSSFDTSNVKDMRHMFNYCASLETIDLSNFDTSSLEDCYHMFDNCRSLTEIDLSNFDFSKVDDFMRMFTDDTALKTIYISQEAMNSIRSDVSANEMFKGCTSLTGGNGTKYDETKTDGEYARIDKEGQSGYFTLKASADTSDRLLGDINGDNKIDVEDSAIIVNHITGVKSLTDEQFSFADINKNGKVDIMDAVTLINHVNGIRPIK